MFSTNTLGKDPSSRHAGRVEEALVNRCKKAKVAAPDAKTLAKILARRGFTSKGQAVASQVASLMALVAKGKLDTDVSIRTGIAVCEALDDGFTDREAWDMALLDGLEEPAQHATACGALAAAGLGGGP